MTEKSQAFAFVVGEVAPAFYGRLDLQKYPLGLALVENFLIDYHGGLRNRSGSKFIAMLAPQVHRFVKFRTKTHDLVLFFTENKMRVLRDNAFITSVGAVGSAIAAGVVTAANTMVVGQLVHVAQGAYAGYFEVTARTAGNFTIASPIGQPIPNGVVTWLPVVETVTTFSDADLESLQFTQDLDKVVCTRNTRTPCFTTRVSDTSWTVTNFSNSLPAAPTGLLGTASAAGAASVGFVVTAVVAGVESAASVELVTTGIINYSTTTGHFTLSWTAVVGATRYNVYRSLIYPAAYPAGAQLGYVGYTTGLSFVDQNISPDYTKTVPVLVDFFTGSNYPATYARFQQRGVYAGLTNDPLTVIGSTSADKGIFSVSFPPIGTDSYSYTIDSPSERPIKHLLALRYGLMLFNDDGITQLRGPDGAAINATGATAEPQGYVSVSDLSPIALNLDVLFMTALNSEFNQMVYTEYTNSFKMQDILVLSTHLFSMDYPATRVDWAAEPYKQLQFIRGDGQKVLMTYERNLEVYGWSRAVTRGEYLDLCVVREDNYNLSYQSVRRTVLDTEVLVIEREMPRHDQGYDRLWYVDAGQDTPLTTAAFDIVLTRTVDDTLPDYLDASWHLTASDISWAALEQIIYADHMMFNVSAINVDHLVLAPMSGNVVSTFYKKNVRKITAGNWAYGTPTTTVNGLWWLEGETVSVLHDGDATLEALVENGTVTVNNASAYKVVGLPYNCRAQSLPLTLSNYVLGGSPLATRGVALRQLESRGLAIGSSFENLEELPSRQDENWDNPLKQFSELTLHELWGGLGWDVEANICFEQKYPLPANILGFTFDLDVGE